MKKINNYIKDSIKWLWQFPQNMLALFIEGMLCLAAFRSGEEEGNTIIMNNILKNKIKIRKLFDIY